MKRSIRLNKKNKKAVLLCIFAAVLAAGLLIWRDQRAQSAFKVGAESTAETEKVSGTMAYKGAEYELNNNIMTVMLIGIDSTGPIEAGETYGDYGRADNIDLLILNRRTGKVSILPISRDTLTPVHRYTMNGYDAGTEISHLGFAYSFGDGGELSCRNTQMAVSDLLFGVTPRYYFTTNLDSIAFLNELVGGVTVTVPNSDVAGRHPELTRGADVKLDEDNVADFLRYRDTEVSYSNNGRMERQQAFLDAVLLRLREMNTDEYEDMWKAITSDDSNILTNMTNGQFVQILDIIRKDDIDFQADLLRIEGENGIEDGYDVFYPDRDRLQELVTETFFVPCGKAPQNS